MWCRLKSADVMAQHANPLVLQTFCSRETGFHWICQLCPNGKMNCLDLRFKKWISWWVRTSGGVSLFNLVLSMVRLTWHFPDVGARLWGGSMRNSTRESRNAGVMWAMAIKGVKMGSQGREGLRGHLAIRQLVYSFLMLDKLETPCCFFPVRDIFLLKRKKKILIPAVRYT